MTAKPLAFALVLAMLAMLAWMTFSNENESETYTVWCRVHKRTDVQFSDWKYLRDRHMLPGQDTGAYEEAKNAQAAAAFSVGFSAGTAGSR